MLKHIAYKFKVTGSMPFPIDMLRYDSCFPASEHDAYMIRDSIERICDRPVTVELRTYQERKHWTATAGRWKSFDWEVSEAVVEHLT